MTHEACFFLARCITASPKKLAPSVAIHSLLLPHEPRLPPPFLPLRLRRLQPVGDWIRPPWPQICCSHLQIRPLYRLLASAGWAQGPGCGCGWPGHACLAPWLAVATGVTAAKPAPLAYRHPQPLFSSQKLFPKSATVSITSNFAIRAWSIKCRRKQKLIAQFGWKLRDERFEPN